MRRSFVGLVRILKRKHFLSRFSFLSRSAQARPAGIHPYARFWKGSTVRAARAAHVVEKLEPRLAFSMADATSLINLDAFRSDPRFSGIDGSGTAIVFIDAGMVLNHPFFGPDDDRDGVADRIIHNYDFFGADDPSASAPHGHHGSAVAAIAASSNSAFLGIAPAADIIALKVFDDIGAPSDSATDIEQALQWTVSAGANPAAYRVSSQLVAVNLSLGINAHLTEPLANNPWMDELASLSLEGIVPVAATGNSYGPTARPGVDYPAADPHVFGVSAVYASPVGPQTDTGTGAHTDDGRPDDIVPSAQRYPNLTTVLAPGGPFIGYPDPDAIGDIDSITPLTATSFATPVISGAIALAQQLAMSQLGRQLSFSELRDLIRRTGSPVVDDAHQPDNVPDTGAVYPRIDMLALGNAIWNMPRPPGSPSDNVPPAANIVDVTPDPRLGSVASIDILFSESVGPINTGFSLDDLALTRNGQRVPLKGKAVLSTENNRRFTLQGLSELTAADGDYTLTLHDVGSPIHDAAGNRLRFDASDEWTVRSDTTGPQVLDIADVEPDPRSVPVDSIDVGFSEPLALSTFSTADITLVRDNIVIPLGSDVTFTAFGTKYRVGGLSAYTALPGRYLFTVTGAGVTDQSGNQGTGLGRDFWTNTSVAGTAQISGHVFDDRNRSGLWDADEPPMPGWRVYVDADGNDHFDDGEAYAISDSSGSYTLAQLTEGSLRVRQEPIAGWDQTLPSMTGVRLSHNERPDMNPVIDETHLVWNSGSDLILAKGARLIALSTSSDAASPVLDRGSIAWAENGSILLFDGSSTRAFSIPAVQLSAPALSNNRFVATGYVNGRNQVFFFDGTTLRQITDDTQDELNPRIEGDVIAWRRGFSNSEIYVFQPSTGLTRLVSTSPNNSPPQVGRFGAVWEGDGPGNSRQVFLFDGTTTRQLSDNLSPNGRPITRDTSIAWLRLPIAGDAEVVVYDGNTVRQLTDDLVKEDSLTAGGGSVVWREFDDAHGELVIFRQDAAHAVTNNRNVENNPAVFGTLVAWSMTDGSAVNDQEIYRQSIVPGYDFVVRRGQAIVDADFGLSLHTRKPGDANGDGLVTGADYTIWAANFGRGLVDATVGEGDFNGDGKVTGADYTIWAANFTVATTARLPAQPATMSSAANLVMGSVMRSEPRAPQVKLVDIVLDDWLLDSSPEAKPSLQGLDKSISVGGVVGRVAIESVANFVQPHKSIPSSVAQPDPSRYMAASCMAPHYSERGNELARLEACLTEMTGKFGSKCRSGLGRTGIARSPRGAGETLFTPFDILKFFRQT